MVDNKELIKQAIEASKNAYAPMSHFTVGAALLAESGKIYLGCNIENSSYPATNCAERTAFFKAISEGEKNFSAIAIVGGKDRDFSQFCSPCGICRQVMNEFVEKDFKIILAKGNGEYKEYTLEELLPLGFKL